MKTRFIYSCLGLFLSLNLLFGQCTVDCVWPGDANANGIANHMDVLALGLSWGTTGPVRIDQSTAWEGLDADNWTESLPVSGSNFKHSDCDGNGIVTITDVQPITNNFQMTNSLFVGLLGNNFLGNDLRAIPNQTVITPGSNFTIDLQLGTAANPIENIYGIGFTLNLNQDYIQNVTLDIDNSWLADNPDFELIRFTKYPNNANQFFVGLSRTDGMPISGFGTIAQLDIVIIDVIEAFEIDSTACLTTLLTFENVLGINEFEEDLLLTSGVDSFQLKDPSQFSSTAEPSTPSISVFPNPVKDELTLSYPSTIKPLQITLYDSMGKIKFHKKIEPSPSPDLKIQLSIAHLDSGVFWMELEGEKNFFTKKIVLCPD